MPFPTHRLRRLRATEALRGLVRETRLSPAQFILIAEELFHFKPETREEFFTRHRDKRSAGIECLVTKSISPLLI